MQIGGITSNEFTNCSPIYGSKVDKTSKHCPENSWLYCNFECAGIPFVVSNSLPSKKNFS